MSVIGVIARSVAASARADVVSAGDTAMEREIRGGEVLAKMKERKERADKGGSGANQSLSLPKISSG
jgi:hypothetical protein